MKLPAALLALLALLSLGSGSAFQVILGDPVTFPDPEKCALDEPAELHRIGASGIRPVAARIEGVWRPDPDYEGRVSEESPRFTFSRSVYTDTGLYQLTCGGLSAEIHLNVLFGFDASVSEGGPVRLDCHYSTSGSHVDSVRWEKDGKVVLERSLSSGKTEGSEPRASFPPGGDRDGDWSLLLDAARLQDEGDYFCSVRYKGAREAWGEPAAVRLKVHKRDPDPDQTTPPHC
ncbi:hypothetical protein L3Q82_003927 [Scortum barcoo]|uniref:Uncharacterized protein n=1 Tax=Scortum barcoo TaxID=214431 RepID=A0ACB8X6C2_9TELE|nr:hypothetical protein L3Q82_003927 [Scortum barcoo]